MLHEKIYKSFYDVGINKILTLSPDTTLDYVIDNGGTVLWLSAANLDFLVNLLVPY